MEQVSVYYLSPKNRFWQKTLFIMAQVVISAAIITFLLYLILLTPFAWDVDAVKVLVIAFCVASPFYMYRRIAKQLKYTCLQISDTDVTLSVPPRKISHINFADIKKVDKTKQGIILLTGTHARHMMMISNQFEGFEEIEARIGMAVPQELVKSLGW